MSKPKILTDIENKIDKDSIINNLTTGGADKVASAETVKTLNNSKAPTLHTHTKANITDFPTSLPANGGNADTLDGLHANQFVRGDGSTSPLLSTDTGNRLTLLDITTNAIGYSDAPTISEQSDGGVFAQAYSPSWVGLIYIDYRTGRLYTNGKNNGSWGSWKEIWDNVSFPKNHAVTSETYGGGTTNNYGHVKVINSILASGSTDDSVALHANQGKVLNDTINTKAPNHQSGTTAPSAFVGEGVLYGVHN